MPSECFVRRIEKRRHRPPFRSYLPAYTRNDSPQPHSSLAFGLLNLKPSFNPSRAKSSSVPSIYARLFGSTTTFTPLHSNTSSSGASSSTYSSLYARPEQPVVRTPTRSPTPFPRRDRY